MEIVKYNKEKEDSDRTKVEESKRNFKEYSIKETNNQYLAEMNDLLRLLMKISKKVKLALAINKNLCGSTITFWFYSTKSHYTIKENNIRKM